MGDTINPLWQPNWPAADASELPWDGALTKQHNWEKTIPYGGNPEAPLLAGIVGHNLCLDRFGAPHPGEVKPLHGEAGVIRWQLLSSSASQVTFGTTLTAAKLQISRSFSLNGNEARVQTSVKPVADVPTEVEWCEHVTIGDPFMDGCEVKAAISHAWNWPGEIHDHFRFKELGPLAEILPAEKALAVPPASDATPYGDVIGSQVVQPWFEVVNKTLGKKLRYEWDIASFPWLCLWLEHRCRTMPPWNSHARARGFEFSSKPFPEGQPPASRAMTFNGVNTKLVIPATGKTTEFSIHWTTL